MRGAKDALALRCLLRREGLRMKYLLTQLYAYARAVYRAHPARINALVVSAVVAAASALGVIVDSQSVVGVVAIVVPILLGGEATHRLVSPVP